MKSISSIRQIKKKIEQIEKETIYHQENVAKSYATLTYKENLVKTAAIIFGLTFIGTYISRLFMSSTKSKYVLKKEAKKVGIPYRVIFDSLLLLQNFLQRRFAKRTG